MSSECEFHLSEKPFGHPNIHENKLNCKTFTPYRLLNSSIAQATTRILFLFDYT